MHLSTCRLKKVVTAAEPAAGSGGGGASAARLAASAAGSFSPPQWASLEESGGQDRLSSLASARREPPQRRGWVDGSDSASTDLLLHALNNRTLTELGYFHCMLTVQQLLRRLVHAYFPAPAAAITSDEDVSTSPQACQ